MLKDIPYSVLKQDGRAYEIMLLRDQHGNTFSDIAKAYDISVARVKQIYNKIKIRQIRLYIKHVSIVSGHENTSQIRAVFNDAHECYQDLTCACAYMEKKYNAVLSEYRGGEPGMPVQFKKGIPPFRRKLSKKIIARVVEMRDAYGASFVTIAKQLRMTQAKAKHTYNMFYHGQVLELIKALQGKAESDEEKEAIWDYYFKEYNTAKKRYDALTKDKPST